MRLTLHLSQNHVVMSLADLGQGWCTFFDFGCMAPLSLPQHRARSLGSPGPHRRHYDSIITCVIAAPALLSTAFNTQALSCHLVALPIRLVTQILLYVAFASRIDAHALSLVSSAVRRTVLPVLYHNVRNDYFSGSSLAALPAHRKSHPLLQP